MERVFPNTNVLFPMSVMRKTRPPMPVPAIAKALEKAGVPEFADRAFTLWEETDG